MKLKNPLSLDISTKEVAIAASLVAAIAGLAVWASIKIKR